MTHREKVDAALAYLKTRKITGSNAAPPLFKLFWALGLNIPPPHFLGFMPTAIILGIPFGVLWTAAMAVIGLIAGLQVEPWILLGLPGIALVSGALFGVTVAAHYRWTANRLGLPSWSDFEKYEASEDSDGTW